jgi:DNA-directed RNA polymerase specialized sigma24 family protein
LENASVDHSNAFGDAPIDEALGCLPVQLRMSFILCDIEGFSYSVAGRILRQPKSHVAQSLFQARYRLRTLIRERKSRRPPIER